MKGSGLMAIPWKPVVSQLVLYYIFWKIREINMHHTKDKGDLGVLKAQVDLFEQGFMILNPCTGSKSVPLECLIEGKTSQE